MNLFHVANTIANVGKEKVHELLIGEQLMITIKMKYNNDNDIPSMLFLDKPRSRLDFYQAR